MKDKLTEGVIRKLIWTDTRDMTADGHTKGSIKRTALHMLMDGTVRAVYERETLELHKRQRRERNNDRSISARGGGQASSKGAPTPRAARVPRRPAAITLLSLLLQAVSGQCWMADTANELAAHDNPFALLCIGRTSVEAAYDMTNDDYQRAYRRASLQLHPDKCQGDA